MTLAAWLHNIDPIALPIWGDLAIRWYGLSYLVGFFIGWLCVRRVTRVGASTLRPEQATDLVITLAIGVVAGGRLGYVFFYQPALLWTILDGLPYWGVLALNQGGMASHGGMIGGVVACWLFARRHQQPLPHLFDLFAFGAPLGLFFGRIANFINGELFGRAAPDWLPWAVKFPQEMRDWDQPRINALYDALLGNGVTQAAHWHVGDLIHQVQQGNASVIAVIEPMLIARHPSQLYAAVLEGLVVFAVLLWLWRRPRKPGVVAFSFGIAYGLMRIINEIFRLPDSHIADQEFAMLGITRGQWLSAVLVLVGIGGVWYCSRRLSSPMGSWRRGPWTARPDVNQPPKDAGPSPKRKR